MARSIPAVAFLCALLCAPCAPAAAPKWGPYRGANTRPTITEEDVRDFAALGGNLLRVTCNTRPLMDKQAPYALNEANLAQLDRLIGYCEKYRVRVVIDPHTTPGTGRETTTTPADPLWQDFSWHEHLIRLWDHLARRYAGKGEVIAGYDLLNEPSIPNGGAQGTPADWNLLVRKLVKTIRAADRTHTIIIEPPTIRTSAGKTVNRLEAMAYLEPVDDANAVYSPHMYEPHQFTHQGVQGRPEPVPYPETIAGRRWDRKTVEETLRPVAEFQKKHGASIFMGEFSAPRWRGEDANRYLRDVIEVCEANGWSWAYHAWREWEGWDAERNNFDKADVQRKSSTPRLELLKSFFAKNGEAPLALSKLEHGKLERTYRLYRPPELDRARRAPLVFVLHGAGGESGRMPGTTKFNELARAKGFLVAYADGFEKHWNDLRGIPEWSAQKNDVDDVGFFSALIDKLVAAEGADPARVYVTGISNGGLMSHRLGCELADKITAIAPVVRTLTERLAGQCKPARPIPVLMFFGTADKLVPFEGGLQKMGSVETPVLSAYATIAKWAHLDGCAEPARIVKENQTERRSYSGCRGGSAVTGIVREGAGHSWPPGAAEVIWSFFEQAPPLSRR